MAGWLPVLVCTLWCQGAASRASSDPPRLAVLIAVDQLRADYLVRLLPLMAGGGFRRFVVGGAGHPRALIRHAATETGPGHALLATGCDPHLSGITGNFWMDLDLGRPVYCVGRDRTPRFLEAPTIGDLLRRRYGEQALVVSLSLKDRAAILMGGKDPDLALWYGRGRFVTSPYYLARRKGPRRKALAAALARWQGSRGPAPFVTACRGAVWRRFCPPGTRAGRLFEALLPPDDRSVERPPPGLRRTFPHRLPKSARADGLLPWTPFGHEALLALAAALLADPDVALGRDPVPDLLCISISTLDYAGHAFGPRSHEANDLVLRLDRDLAAFFEVLDRIVGAGHWVAALSADHGVSDAPGSSPQAPKPFAPFAWDPKDSNRDGLWIGLAKELARRFAPRLPEGFEPVGWSGVGPLRRPRPTLFGAAGRGLVFRRRALADYGLEVEEVAVVAAEWLARRPEVACVLGPGGVRGRAALALGPLLERARFPGRSPDLLVAFDEGLCPWSPGPGLAASHGSVRLADREVPLWFTGCGVRRGLRLSTRPGPEDLAPTLARLLGLDGMHRADGRVLAEVLQGP